MSVSLGQVPKGQSWESEEHGPVGGLREAEGPLLGESLGLDDGVELGLGEGDELGDAVGYPVLGPALGEALRRRDRAGVARLDRQRG